MVVGRDTLYIYGGMMEIKDREITLDDLYALNLSKLDEWKCIIPVCYFLYQHKLDTFFPVLSVNVSLLLITILFQLASLNSRSIYKSSLLYLKIK